jgi:hypothetical protein
MTTEQARTTRQIRKLARENWYRDVWLVAVTVLVAASLTVEAKRTSEIQEGRRTTLSISCAVSAAVVKAGRVIIVSSSKQGLPPKLELFLEQHGLPPKKLREQGAARSAESYTSGINQEIVNVSGVKAAQVLNKDGTLNCNKLRTLAKLK